MTSALSRIALICGGPSAERGISLNSTRSVVDHLSVYQLEIEIYYVNAVFEVYQLDQSLIYSNTCEDFDYKLESQDKLSEQSWISQLQRCDLVYPLIHGPYGEDGAIQLMLEKNHIAFVGAASLTCQKMFDKGLANQYLDQLGFDILNSQYYDISKSVAQIHQLQNQMPVVLKPSKGGSSLGVHIVHDLHQAQQAITDIQSLYDCDILVQEYCTGVEFTVVVIESHQGPIALMPAEIVVQVEGIYSYQRKYLPSSCTRIHCPPRFSQALILKIRQQAQQLFKHFKMRDVARLDGWIVDQKIIFSDFNPVSGLEQNSFVFIQASQLGMSHQMILGHIINNAASRVKKILKLRPKTNNSKKPVYVLMGGASTEKQVSLMSGTNVWLKLNASEFYQPYAYFLDHEEKVWSMAYSHLLNHTVEEVFEQLTGPKDHYILINQIRKQLSLDALPILSPSLPMSVVEFVNRAKEQQAQVFLALHGGLGEDGRLQQILELHQIPFNGSMHAVASLAMDKYAFSKWVNAQNIQGVSALSQLIWKVAGTQEENDQWIFKQLSQTKLIAKPRFEGCSKGISIIESASDLKDIPEGYIIEPYISTDQITVRKHQLKHEHVSGYVELTVVVWQEQGRYRAKPPSLSVAASAFLSEAEKFQGGTGINFTPPPKAIMSERQVEIVQEKLEQIAVNLSLRHYARFDLFYHCQSNHMIIIEMNTLPALTPSTVLFHQMLACKHSRSPKQVLEALCDFSS